MQSVGSQRRPGLGREAPPTRTLVALIPLAWAYNNSLGIAAVLPEEKHRRDGGSAGRLVAHTDAVRLRGGRENWRKVVGGLSVQGSPLKVRVGWE